MARSDNGRASALADATAKLNVLLCQGELFHARRNCVSIVPALFWTRTWMAFGIRVNPATWKKWYKTCLAEQQRDDQ